MEVVLFLKKTANVQLLKKLLPPKGSLKSRRQQLKNFAESKKPINWLLKQRQKLSSARLQT